MHIVGLLKQNRIIVCSIAFCIFTVFILVNIQQLRLKFFAWLNDAVYIDSKDVIFQKNNNDCGPTALLMIFRYHNIVSDQPNLLKEAALTDNGTSLWQLKEIAEDHGLEVTARLMELESIDNNVTPLLVYLENSHFVVLDSVTAEYAIIRDPQIGRIKFTLKTLRKIWLGMALIFKKQDVSQ